MALARRTDLHVYAISSSADEVEAAPEEADRRRACTACG
jgi:hypothetical protein